MKSLDLHHERASFHKTVVVTGATSGIGLEVSKALLSRGAQVILCTKTKDHSKSMLKLARNPNAHLLHMDLADLEHVQGVVAQIRMKFQSVDILVNNAGVMEPDYGLTKQGFESQFGINYLGHFALTSLLLQEYPALERVVTVSSLAAEGASLDYETFKAHQPYDKSKAYRQSKLANLIFSFELRSRLIASGRPTLSVAAHPGYARTRLQRHVKGLPRKAYARVKQFTKAQSAKNGAWSILCATLDPDATGLEYYVPGGAGQLSGDPIKIAHPALEFDAKSSARLWEYSENMVNTKSHK